MTEVELPPLTMDDLPDRDDKKYPARKTVRMTNEMEDRLNKLEDHNKDIPDSVRVFIDRGLKELGL